MKNLRLEWDGGFFVFTCDIYQRPRNFFSYPLVIIKVIIIFAIIIILIEAGKNE